MSLNFLDIYLPLYGLSHMYTVVCCSGQHSDEQHAGNANRSLFSPDLQKNCIFYILSQSDYTVVAPRMMHMIRPLTVYFKREPKTKQLRCYCGAIWSLVVNWFKIVCVWRSRNM